MTREELMALVAGRRAAIDAKYALASELERRFEGITAALGSLENGITLTKLTAFYNAVKAACAGRS